MQETQTDNTLSIADADICYIEIGYLKCLVDETTENNQILKENNILLLEKID